ncbi:hypothetical protein BH23BAC1_BH23BAC1_09470 [soil metagenome]
MNIKNYISSGILESYVLGELSREERIEVERNAEEYSEINEEIRHIKEAFHNIHLQTITQVETKQPEQHKIIITEQASPANTAPSLTAKSNSTKEKFLFLSYFAATSATIALISLYAAVDLYYKWKGSEAQLNQVKKATTILRPEVDLAEEEILKFNENDYHIYFNENFKIIELNGLENSPESHAIIFWNEKSQEVFLKVKSLPKVNDWQQFQLWALVDGEAVDAGVIPKNREDIVRMNRIKNASAFSVTLEPVGGNRVPDLEQGYMHGSVIQ